MNREILFKAKRKDNGEWVEGYYQQRFDADGRKQHFIFWSKSYTVWEYVEIDSDTLCQYTGVTDKHDKMIWENDIVKYDIYLPGYIVWDRCACGLYIKIIKTGTLIPFTSIYRENMKVIGNIFNNPDFNSKRQQ